MKSSIILVGNRFNPGKIILFLHIGCLIANCSFTGTLYHNSARLSPVGFTGSSASYPQAAKIPAFRSSRLRGLFAALPSPALLLVFSGTHFCKPPRIRHSVYLIPQAPFRCRRACQPAMQKDATFQPPPPFRLCQKKTNPAA
jgi:hypothetical protein